MMIPLLRITALAMLVMALFGHGADLAAAEAEVRLRVLTYNIRIGLGSAEPDLNPFDGRKRPIDLSPVIAAIASTEADVVALQEVLGKKQARTIATALGMDSAYARHGPKYGKWWGLAVLSKFPITASESQPISTGRGNTRSDLVVTLRLGERRLTVINTHADKDIKDGAPQRHTMAHVTAIEGPKVLLGDFNVRPASGRLDAVRAALNDATDALTSGDAAGLDRHPTFRRDGKLVPGKRIDYIFVDPRFIRVHGVGLLDPRHWPASDHIGVFADLSLTEK